MSRSGFLPSFITPGVCGFALLGVAGARYIYSLFQYPSLQRIEERATKPMKHVGSDDELTVFGFEAAGEHPDAAYGVTDTSPFAIRVETFLRLVGEKYTKTEGKHGSNPRGKIPFANIYGQMVDDSQRIIDAVKARTGKDPDKNLSRQQLAVGCLVREMLHHSTYWIICHNLFQTEPGREVIGRFAEQRLPAGLRHLLLPKIYRDIFAYLKGAGFAALPTADIVRKGQTQVRSLGAILGRQKYILGTDKPTTYDVDVYAFLVFLFYEESQIRQPWVPEIKKECSNLVTYVDRMRDRLYPDLRN